MRFLLFLSGAATLAVSHGCGQGPELARVRGVVQHNGTPLDGGKVLFSPLKRARPAVGQIQSDGTYELTTFRKGDGATPGKYRITVVTDLEVRGNKIHVTCLAPTKFLLEVEAGKENQFVVNVSRANGWRQVVDD